MAEELNGAPQVGPAPLPPDPSKPDNVDDLLAELNRLPIFMTSLDETDGQGGSNAALDALKSLQYEGTKSEVANNFREQGNECARAKDWQNARDFYSQALDVIAGKVQKIDEEPSAAEGNDALRKKLDGDVGPREIDWLDNADADGNESSKVVDLEEEVRRMNECEELCRSNRALCNLELKNHGSAVRDATAALKINPNNTKALYRSALALLALDKTPQSLSAIGIGLNFARSRKDNASIKSFSALQNRVESRANHIATVERERSTREQRQRTEQLAIKQALKQRGIIIKQSERGQPDLEDAKLALEDPLDPNSDLKTPLLLLYPTAAQSELMKEMKEGDTMRDLLQTILPVPFSEDGASPLEGFDASQVDCFVVTAAGGLRKVGKKVLWRRVIEKGGAVLEDGMFAVHVVPKERVAWWIAEWKKRNGRS